MRYSKQEILLLQIDFMVALDLLLQLQSTPNKNEHKNQAGREEDFDHRKGAETAPSK